jgi:two-component system sensor histidine kinase BarA
MRLPFVSSIRARLVLLVVTAITLAQAFAMGLSLWQETSRYALSKRETLVSTAETLAAAVARPLLERNTSDMHDALRAIARIETMQLAIVETPDGQHMADTGSVERLTSDLIIQDPGAALPLMQLLRSRSVEIVVPVITGGAEIGRLRLVADTTDLPARIGSAVGITLLGAIGALLLALVVALRMQGAITRPLQALTSAMSRVRRSHDYNIRMPAAAQDEIGILVNGFNAMIGDIRERDTRLALHRENLEREVAERTDDFRRAAADAESANRAKSDFLATMSHEIRTPMNGILVMAELLAAGELPPRLRRQAEVIARSGQSLLAIINDILDFSKIEAGKLEVEHLDVDACDAVETVLRLFADRAHSKGLDLSASIAFGRGAAFTADPVRLGQVLSNLVNNALKFTERGGVLVHVAPDETSPNHARISVIDTGIGIPAEKLASIFDAFSQADQSTTRQYGGTGLGLAIARRLVAAMGGELAVDSEVGVGTRFHFALPLAHAGSSWPTLPAREHTPRAVVALDGEQTGFALAAILSEAGYATERVAAGDWRPASEGAALLVAPLSALRDGPRSPAGKVIALARADEDAGALMGKGVIDAPLGWPLTRSEVDEIVVRLVAGRSLRDLDRISLGTGQKLPSFAGLKVLVADDSEVNREVASTALQRLGITPDLVNDGAQALRATLTCDYDIVLMDGSMPVMDGFEATRRIRQMQEADGGKLTPIVALTAHVIGSGADAWREAGMDGVLHKPFTLAQLSEVLSAHARGAQQAVNSTEAHSDGVAAAGGSHLDRSALDELRAMANGSSDVIARITRLYRLQSQDKLADIMAAVESRNLEALAAAAHALKSMSYNIGARGVAERAAAFEQGARISGDAGSPAAVADLEAELHAVHAELDNAA